MIREPRDDEERLERILGGVAESVLLSTDEQIEAEARDDGLDPATAAEEVRSVLLGAVERYRSTACLVMARNGKGISSPALNEGLRH